MSTGEVGGEASQPSGRDLVKALAEGKVDHRTVMTYVLEKIGMVHRADEILRRADGNPITLSDGRLATARDYLGELSDKHHATNFLLGFAAIATDHPQYDDARRLMLDSVGAYLPLEDTARE